MEPIRPLLFQNIINTLLADNSLKNKFKENILNTIFAYLTRYIRVHTLSKDTLEKLIALHTKFLSALIKIIDSIL